MDKKDVIIRLNKLRNDLHDRQCWCADGLIELRNLIADAGLECKFDLSQYLTYEELWDRIKEELDNWWVDRLFYFLNDIDNLRNFEVIKLDNYWNCDCKIFYGGLIEVVDGIIDEVEWMQDEDFD